MKLINVAWNLIGLLCPLLIAAIAIPLLLNRLGDERFGLLALTWGLIGYAGILDLGIGRALTKVVSALLGSDDQRNIPVAVKTAVTISIKISFIGAAFMFLLAITGSIKFLKIEKIPESEIVFSAVIFSIALPLQSLSATFKGVNEAYLNFKAISIIRVILGVSTFGLPLAISYYTIAMPALIGSIVVSRAFALIFYKRQAEKCIEYIGNVPEKFSEKFKKEIFRFGGWFTISNIINPIIASCDKLMLSGLISVGVVANYSIAYEITTQLLVGVGAVTTVMFPYLANQIQANRRIANILFLKFLTLTVAVMFLVMLLLQIWGAYAMNFWLGNDYVLVLGEYTKILSYGLIPYTVGTMSLSFLHSIDRVDLTAKIHVVEFPIFLGVIYFLVSAYGVHGACWAWVLRVSIDSLAMVLALLNVAVFNAKESGVD